MPCKRLPIALCLAALCLAPLLGCGPAFRYRPADTLAKGHVELGGGVGAGVRMNDGSFGGGELQAWVRGGADDRVEVGARFFSHMLSSFGGALDLRFAPIKGPIDISLDLSLLGGACCLAGSENRVLGAAIGIDGGISIGKRFGHEFAPAIYFAPHVQLSRTLPFEKDWPNQLFLPIGVDIPVGRTVMRIRPEVVVAGLFYRAGRMDWRVAGGVGLALSGPGPKLRRERKRAAIAEEAARAEE
jgi:hypothetical protein